MLGHGEGELTGRMEWWVGACAVKLMLTQRPPVMLDGCSSLTPMATGGHVHQYPCDKSGGLTHCSQVQCVPGRAWEAEEGHHGHHHKVGGAITVHTPRLWAPGRQGLCFTSICVPRI